MAVILSILASIAYGGSDFLAGAAGRRSPPEVVAVMVQTFGLLAAGTAVATFGRGAPDAAILVWGAVSGVGSALGTLALFRGLARGPMAVVAPASAVLTAAVPALVGIGLGEAITPVGVAGVVVAVPAVAAVARSDRPSSGGARRSGAVYGCAAGLGFALLLVALHEAGTAAGAWPLVPGQAVSLLLLVPFGVRHMRGRYPTNARTGAVPLIAFAGVLSGAANLLYLAATGRGSLPVVAVLTALYPGVTILCARLFLSEHLNSWQVAGLVAAAVAVILISVN